MVVILVQENHRHNSADQKCPYLNWTTTPKRIVSKGKLAKSDHAGAVNKNGREDVVRTHKEALWRVSEMARSLLFVTALTLVQGAVFSEVQGA